MFYREHVWGSYGNCWWQYHRELENQNHCQTQIHKVWSNWQSQIRWWKSTLWSLRHRYSPILSILHHQLVPFHLPSASARAYLQSHFLPILSTYLMRQCMSRICCLVWDRTLQDSPVYSRSHTRMIPACIHFSREVFGPMSWQAVPSSPSSAFSPVCLCSCVSPTSSLLRLTLIWQHGWSFGALQAC